MSKRYFYLTTTLPYINAEPHIGFALEIIQADVIARHKQLQGYEIFFNTGTDEHGQKIYQKALESGEDIKTYTDRLALKFKELLKVLNISPEINFIRTTDDHHLKSAQAFWQLADEAGFIYKKNYTVKYCVGCELEKTDSELEHDRCPIHPNKDLESITEENYFFKFSALAPSLLKLYEERPDFVLPAFRLKEIKTFVEGGLQDFSISRVKEKMPWGIPVPNDQDQVMYVWFDALVNYVSAIGWPDDQAKFKQWWQESGGVMQFAGKDNLRQQSAMWQAMLLAVGLPPSRQIFIHGFINGPDGQKMSKSLGNGINPLDLVEEFGVEAVRYYFVRHINNFEDSDFSIAMFKEIYNANLAKGLGNVVSRLMKMAETNLTKSVVVSEDIVTPDFDQALNNFDLNGAVNLIWIKLGKIDQKIAETEPFKLIKTNPESARLIISELVSDLYQIALMLRPIMPETAKKIMSLIKANQMPAKPLFKNLN